MSKEYNSTLQARVEQFLKDKGISQAKAAPMMGISQTALSQYRRSMYDNGAVRRMPIRQLHPYTRTGLCRARRTRGTSHIAKPVCIVSQHPGGNPRRSRQIPQTVLIGNSSGNGLSQLVGARCATATAINASEPADGIGSIGTLAEHGHTVGIAGTSAGKLYIM